MTEYTHNTRYPGENDAYRIAGNELLKTNLVVVIKSPIGRIMDFARSRNWQDIKLLSSFNNNYNSDCAGFLKTCFNPMPAVATSQSCAWKTSILPPKLFTMVAASRCMFKFIK